MYWVSIYLHFCLLYLSAIIYDFQKDIGPFLQSIFVPLVSAIFTALSEPLEENDEEEKRTRRLLQRNYYLFLTTIVSSNLLDVMASLDSGILQQVDILFKLTSSMPSLMVT